MSTLLAGRPFYIAHRGGGGDWPEMTAYAYQQASRVPGLTSLEVSVCLSADGVLVCSHDPTTRRLGSLGYVIANETWSTLSAVQVSARQTVDPRQPPRPLTRLDEVLERYRDTHVLFVEPKVGPAAAPLMAAMVRNSRPEAVVWKQPINSTRFAEAKRHGFATWGYVLDEPAHTGSKLARYAASGDVDVLGAQLGNDELARQVVRAARANGKQTIIWPVKSTSNRATAEQLGASGLMASNPVELLGPPQ